MTTSCTADYEYFIDEKQVTFTDKSTTEPNDPVWDYFWDFGDGNTARGVKNPTHTYQNTGTYNVCLTITTQFPCEDKTCKNVVIDTSCCRTNKSVKTGTKGDRIIDIGNDRGLKGKAWIRSYPYARRVGAKTKAYRKKKGKWRKVKADYIECNAGGKVYTPGDNEKCERSATFNLGKFKKNKKKTRESLGFGRKINAKRNSISSYHEVQDNGARGNRTIRLLAKEHCD